MNPYQILNIPPGSPREVVEQAFRAAAQRSHPSNGGTREQFAQVVAAYNTIQSATAPPPAPRTHTTEVLAPAPRYVIPPRIHAAPTTRRAGTGALRGGIGAGAAAIAFAAGYVFAAAAVTPLTVAAAVVAFAAGAAAAPQLVVAAYVPAARRLLIAAAAGLALWPLIVGAVAAAAAAAGIFYVLRGRQLIS